MGPDTLNALAAQIREINDGNGWSEPHDSPVHQIAILALIGTEVSEAIEEVRNGNGMSGYQTIHGQPVYPVIDGSGADWTTTADGCPVGFDVTWTGVTPKPEGMPSELADIIIRTLDFAAMFNIDVDKAVAEKLAYNRTRGRRHGGKTL